MLRNLLILPEGTKLFSGSATENAIQSVTLTQCVNSEVELTIGSTCANMLEATLITPNGGLSLTAGDEVTLFKVDENTLHKVGVFILEKPTRPTAHTMKLTGYDRVTKLDKDLTEWLKGLDGWPYNILTFATMVCDACGVTFVPNVVPNQDYAVEQFTKSGVTGRQIMKWIGEVCCRFVRANADGAIELAWYTPATIAIGASQKRAVDTSYENGNLTLNVDGAVVTEDAGSVSVESEYLQISDDGQGNVTLVVSDAISQQYYFQNGLSYEEYSVAPVEAVQIQLADGGDAYRWPEVQEGTNSYVISGNPMLNGTTNTVEAALRVIYSQLSKITYTPCKVSLPAVLDIHPGHIVRIVDKNKKSLSMLVMSKTTAGQKDTFECTGSPRRDSTTAQNNKPVDVAAVAQQAVNSQTQEDIFNKLTNGGKMQGIYLKDGEIYINASYIKAGELLADLLKTGVISSADGTVKVDLTNNKVVVATLIDGRKGKIELTASGINGYGWDSTAGDYYNTLSITPGSRTSESSESFTTITSVGSDAGLAIYGATNESATWLGDIGSETRIYGNKIMIAGKYVWWKDNGDGTCSLTATK